MASNKNAITRLERDIDPKYASVVIHNSTAYFAGIAELGDGPTQTIEEQWIDAANKPVRARVQSSMALPEYLVEIQITAAVPRARFHAYDMMITIFNDLPLARPSRTLV